MKAIFATPIIYDGNDARYLQRDGARFAFWFAEHGHEAVKLIYSAANGSQKSPESKFLICATYEDWCSKTFWEQQGTDIVLLYGGFGNSLLPVARAIRAANGGKIKLFLKMDSAFGLLPASRKNSFFFLQRSYFIKRQRHGIFASFILSSAGHVF
jgi:hypothetical protein